MKQSSKPAILVLAILLSFASCARLCAEASATLSSRFLARGEQAVLELAVTKRPGQIPQLPTIEGVTALAPSPGWQTRLMPGRRLEYVYTYVISSYEIGSHTIPSLEISAGNEIHRTQPVEFSIFNPDELRWSEAISGRSRFRFASAFRVLNDQPYVGECTPIEIKVYVPRDLFVEDWGIPDFERDGLTAWRFQPKPIRGQLNLLGMPYTSASYPSTITPVREGAIAIGPAKLRLMTMEVVMDGILRRVTNEVHLNIPALELNAKALPDGAPDGFDNAVGQFSLEVRSEMTDLIEGDPVPLEIRIQGSGNLDTLRPPQPVDSSGWKLYDATAQTRGDERRELTGSVTFQQFMRPLELKSAIPSFRLVYFDPLARAYQTVTSDPIPLSITPAPVQAVDGIAPPAAADLPIERMTDILGLIEMKSAIQESRLKFPAWAWHALGSLAAFGLILRALVLRHPEWFRASPQKIARRNTLKEIKQLDRNESDQAFLLGCGAMIEKRFGLHPPEALQAVLNERDNHCFKGNDKPESCLTREQRNSISNTLKSHLCIGLGIAFTLLLGIPSARAADPLSPLDAGREAYDSARYDEAIQHWLSAGEYPKLSADLLYNIGNACYRAGANGHAALYYRRALVKDASHAEARQNLRFLERKLGSISVDRPQFQYALAKLPLSVWQAAFWAGLWALVLAILVFPASRPNDQSRLVALVVLVISPIWLAAAGLGWRYFPDDANFAPLARQAVVVADDVVLHNAASRTAAEVIDAPPGSLCEIIRHSGRWAYVAFATRTRGWVPVDALEPLIPQSPPEVPTMRKPRANADNA